MKSTGVLVHITRAVEQYLWLPPSPHKGPSTRVPSASISMFISLVLNRNQPSEGNDYVFMPPPSAPAAMFAHQQLPTDDRDHDRDRRPRKSESKVRLSTDAIRIKLRRRAFVRGCCFKIGPTSLYSVCILYHSTLLTALIEQFCFYSG